MRFVLFNSSSTQRVVVTTEYDDVLISKDWRKEPTEEWRQGKGITLKRDYLIDLGKILQTNIVPDMYETL